MDIDIKEVNSKFDKASITIDNYKDFLVFLDTVNSYYQELNNTIYVCGLNKWNSEPYKKHLERLEPLYNTAFTYYDNYCVRD